MVLPGIIETPRTEAGYATFISNGVPDFSVEESFVPPSRSNQQLVDSLVERFPGKSRGTYLTTPAARMPLTDRRNTPGRPQRAEFTPLLKSVAKSNFTRQRSRENGVPPTPAVLKPGYESAGNSPALPVDITGYNPGDTASSFEPEDAGGATIPPMPSSSALSTPLATLPKSDRGGVITDGQNMMTLKEQENVVNRIEKENFGLKLKIHFLEEALRKAGPGVSEAALRENTDLKVDKVTLQRELLRYRKTLADAERDVESYRKQLQEAQERTIRRPIDQSQKEEVRKLHDQLSKAELEIQKLAERLKQSESRASADERLQQETNQLRREVAEADSEIQSLNARLREAQTQETNTDELHDEIQDLKAESRQKDRLLEDKDDEINDLTNRIASFQVEVERKERSLEEQNAALSALRDDITVLRTDVGRKEALLQEKDNEVNDLKDEIIVLQSNLDEDGEQARQDLFKAHQEIESLKDQVQSLSQEREMQQDQLRLHQEKQARHEACEKERDMLKRQLQIYHDNEAQNEASQKERSMLEKELKDARTRVEVKEKELHSIKQELDNSHTRAGQFEKERNLMRRELDDSRAQNEGYERERNVLKRQLHDCQAQLETHENLQKKQATDQRHQQDSQLKSSAALEQTIAELRAEVSRLQRALQARPHEDNLTTVQQRQELHETVKATKVEVEELQRQLSEHHRLTEAYALEKRDLRARMRRIADERTVQSQKASTAVAELDRLRKQYDVALARAVELEQSSAQQSKAMQRAKQEKDRQHSGELKGLSKQILYLRSRCSREGRFRADLAFVKKYFLMQMEMYNACNHAGLQMLEEMGIIPDRSIREKRPSLKSVAYVVMASLRMKRLKEEWANSLKVKEKLMATAMQTKGKGR